MSLEILARFDGTSFKEMWDAIGYDQSEQDEEQYKLNDALVDAILIYQEQLGQTFQHMKDQIDTTINDYSQLMRAFGVKEEEVAKAVTFEGTLKEGLTKLTSDLETFRAAHKEKFDHLISLHYSCSVLFDTLEVEHEDRGEFDAIGDSDFTDARVQRFAEQIKVLQALVEDRKKRMQEHEKTIKELGRLLETEVPEMNTDDVSMMSMRHAEETQAGLLKAKAMREETVDIKKAEITKLWNVLNVPAEDRHKFTAQFKTIGESVLQVYTDEIERLRGQRQEHLPEIVEQQKQRIRELEAEMHLVDVEEVQTDGKELNEAYDMLDAKFDALQQQFIAMKPFVTLIAQRTELLRETEQLNESARKAELAAKKKKPVDQKQLNKDEQARRRIKSILPRLEKKLLLMLVEHETTKGEPFMWDGEPYSSTLAHIKLSDSELRQAKSGRKKSMGAGRRASQFSAVGDKTTTRRSLENNRAAANH